MGGPAPGADIRWIEVSPAYYEAVHRRSVRGIVPSLAIALAIAATLYFVFGMDVLMDRRFRGLLSAVAIGTVLTVVMVPFAKRLARKQVEGYRLGASSAGLHYELAKSQAPFGIGRSGRAAWRDVCFDGKRLLADRKTLVTVSRRGDALFDAQELRDVIIARVPRANLATQSQMLLRLLFPGGPRGALFIVLAVGVILAVVIATYNR